jgi:hypothetical protein
VQPASENNDKICDKEKKNLETLRESGIYKYKNAAGCF